MKKIKPTKSNLITLLLFSMSVAAWISLGIAWHVLDNC